MAASKPTILLDPGAWQLTTAFEPFADLLKKTGYGVECVSLPTTGGDGKGLPDDIAAIRAVLEPLFGAGKAVVLLTHSAGGVSGSVAVKGLDAKTRSAAGLSGGVMRVIYMAAFVVPRGGCIMNLLGGEPLPWMVIQDGRVTGNPDMMAEVGLSDLSPDDQKKWMREVTFTSAALFGGQSEYEPWKESIPCAYIYAKQDGAIPYSLQQQMAAQLGPDALTVAVDSNHCPFLSVPQELLAAVEKILYSRV